jgi:hypothetical protein
MPLLNPNYDPPPRGMVSNIRSFYIQGYEDGYQDCLRRSRKAREEGIKERESAFDYDKAIYKGKVSTKRKLSAWNKFLKAFKYRKKKPRESAKAYFKARTKAASKKYKRIKK